MSATAKSKPRKVNPARCDLVTLRRMAYPCTLLPNGQPAHVTINGKPYVVSHSHPGVICFHSETDSHIVAGGECTCADFVFTRQARGESCKHQIAAGLMIQNGAL